MASALTGSSHIEIAQAQAEEYIKLLKDWIPRRRETIRELRTIADDIDDIKNGASVGKVSGTAVAVVGGVASVVGIFATGGLATPLLVGGLIGSVAGTATTVASDIIGGYMESGKVQVAQECMDSEKKMVDKIEKAKEKLDVVVSSISAEMGLCEDMVMSVLFMSAMSGRRFRLTGLSFPNLLQLMTTPVSLVLIGAVYITAMEGMAKGMGKAFAGISVKGVSRIAGSVLKGVAAGAMLLWDVYLLVRTSVELSEGSVSKAADALREIASKLYEQHKEVETMLENVEKSSEDFENMIRVKFRERLAEVSGQGYASSDDVEAIKEYIGYCASEDWKSAFMDKLDLDTFAFPLARVVRNLQKAVEEHLEEEEDDDDDVITLTVIAHGNIDTSLAMKFPALFYYMTPTIKSITLYEPWGCAIDATVVHGIVTDTIHIDNVRYSGKVYPNCPDDLNELPRSFDMIPAAVFSPVTKGEPAYNDLMWLFHMYNAQSSGLVIPYFTGFDSDLLPYPTVPLWVFSNAVGLLGIFFKRQFKIRVAACLSVSESGRENGRYVDCSQYCVVDGKADPPVMMTNTASMPRDVTFALQSLNQML